MMSNEKRLTDFPTEVEILAEEGIEPDTDETPRWTGFRLWAGMAAVTLVLGIIGTAMVFNRFMENTSSWNTENELAGSVVGIGTVVSLFPALWFGGILVWSLFVLRGTMKSRTAYYINLILITLLGAIPAFLQFFDEVLFH